MFDAPSDLQSVLFTDAFLAIGLITIARLLDPLRFQDRVLFGLTTAMLLATYAWWRWSDTMPKFSFSLESLWPWLFFTFEIIAITYSVMSIVILFRSSDRTLQADAAERRITTSNSFPPVDVFICTYDEPLEIVERSILCALALNYPSFSVWVLDDTRRLWLQEYCEQVGARYITRADNKGAKAGNLNNGLAVTAAVTNAPVILVLDADFAPTRDFLRRTVGLLSEPGVAIIQTPQFYYNADPIQHNLLATQSWVDDQRFFFDIFQPAKDGWGCAFCVGTSFVVRRDYLEEIGGFPSQAISEDINLSYTMLAHGYQTWWLNERLSFGLSAEGIPEYITQRARWCLGTIQVALLPDGPLFGREFTFTQRWHYLHGILNWLCKPFMVLLLIAPSIYWFGGLPAFEADYLSFLQYGVPALFAQIIYMMWISRSRTLPLFMEATHAVTAFAVTATLLSAIVKPFGRPFKITEKGGDRSTPRVHWKLASTFALIALSSALSVVWAFIAPDAASVISSMDYFNLLWAGIAMLIAFVAFVVCFELPRVTESFDVDESGLLSFNGHLIPCRITSLSVVGGLVSWRKPSDVQSDPSSTKLFIETLGWVDVTLPPRAKNEPGVVLFNLTHEQRKRLIVRLYSSGSANVAREARLSGVFSGLLRRGFRGS